MMGPEMGLYFPHSHLASHRNLPSNRLLYTEFQIASLYSEEHEGNRFATERIGSLFNKIGTSLAVHVHVCKTDINIQRIRQLMTSVLSKRTCGGCPSRLVR